MNSNWREPTDPTWRPEGKTDYNPLQFLLSLCLLLLFICEIRGQCMSKAKEREGFMAFSLMPSLDVFCVLA